MKKFLSFIKKLTTRLQFFVKTPFKVSSLLKLEEKFLLKSIQQTLQEIPEFDYKKWQEKYDDELFYFLFEQQFRGKMEIIKQRQKVYLEYVRQAYEENKTKPWVDIGCGRGEFLELLKEQNIPCIGVDINSVNVDLCNQRGLKVVQEDALSYLSKIEDNTVAGISALHVVEHLPKQQLFNFIKLCFKKISPQGIVIFETVNIRNDTAAKNYYIDPTHNLPLMPEFLSMYLEFVGFNNVFVLYLSPESNLQKHDENDVSIYPDYAIIGTK